jgi:hypothetical protein
MLLFLFVRKVSGLLFIRRDTVQGWVKVSLYGSQISTGEANIVLWENTLTGTRMDKQKAASVYLSVRCFRTNIQIDSLRVKLVLKFYGRAKKNGHTEYTDVRSMYVCMCMYM